MKRGDNIIGRHIHAILEQLKNGKTLVRMILMGKDYEQLTIISDIRKKAATILGINTATVYRKIEKYRISDKVFRDNEFSEDG